MCPKWTPKGFTQKHSVCSGSRAVMWPATPSLNPNRENRRKDAARRSLRWRRSSSNVAKAGGAGRFLARPGTSTILAGASVISKGYSFLGRFSPAETLRRGGGRRERNEVFSALALCLWEGIE